MNFSFGTVLGILAFIGAGYWFWKNSQSKNPVTINQLLEDNAESTFKALGAAGTIIEVINLSLVAMQNMDMDITAAFSRYLVIGVIEILMTFLFMSSVSNSMKDAMEDGKFTFGEYVRTIVYAIPIFIGGMIVTGYIHILYLESIYQLEFQNSETAFNFWGWVPAMSQIRVTNPEYFMLIDPSWMKPISGASVFLIYTTPGFNLLMVIFLWRRLNRENKIAKKQSKKGKKDKDDKTDPNDNKTGLEKYLKKIELWFGIKENDFKTWLGNYIGLDLTTGKSVKHSITDKDILDGKIKSSDLLVEISERLIGDSNKGLEGILNITDDISAMIIEYKTALGELEKMKTEKDRLARKGTNTGNISVEINNLEKDKLPKLKEDIKDEMEHRESLMTETINEFKILNLKVPSYSEQFTKEVNDLLK